MFDAGSGKRLTRSGYLVFEPLADVRQQGNRGAGTITAWGVEAAMYNRIMVCDGPRYGSGLLTSTEIKVARPTVPNPIGLVQGGVTETECVRF